jgi:DNA-binding transcriptional LysR family regulator
MTEEGNRFYNRCVRILAEIEEAKLEAMSGRETAVGLLRITTTLAFGTKHLAPLLAAFQKKHPRLNIHLNTSDNITNIVEAGYDLAVRFGALPDSSLIARQLAPNVRVICGSPDYLDRRGVPTAMEDLLRHDCIVYGEPPLDTWSFTDGRSIDVRGPMSVSSGVLAHELALRGEGLVMKSMWDVYEDVEAKRLKIVLPELRLAAAPIHALYPHGKLAAAKVRLCVDYLAAALKERAAVLPAGP